VIACLSASARIQGVAEASGLHPLSRRAGSRVSPVGETDHSSPQSGPTTISRVRRSDRPVRRAIQAVAASRCAPSSFPRKVSLIHSSSALTSLGLGRFRLQGGSGCPPRWPGSPRKHGVAAAQVSRPAERPQKISGFRPLSYNCSRAVAIEVIHALKQNGGRASAPRTFGRG
jgi:hypothetical protein